VAGGTGLSDFGGWAAGFVVAVVSGTGETGRAGPGGVTLLGAMGIGGNSVGGWAIPVAARPNPRVAAAVRRYHVMDSLLGITSDEAGRLLLPFGLSVVGGIVRFDGLK
jgi:hypothetical protein